MAGTKTRTKRQATAAPGTLRPGGRTERNRQSVAAAALALLRRGETDLSPASVAAEAGVSRSTVYRRWPSRADLLREALTLHTRSLRVPDTGSFESDVHALARRLARFFSDPTEIAMSAAMAAHADPAFDAWQIEYWEALAHALARPFAAAVERGELSEEVDPAILLEMLVGPMVVRTAIMKQELGRRFVGDLADHLIRMAAARSEGDRSESSERIPRQRGGEPVQATLDFDDYHEQILRELLAGDRGHAAGRSAANLPPLALRLPDGRAYTYVPGVSGIGLVAGADTARTVVELDENLWQGLRDSMETPAGLVLFQKAKIVSGKASDFMSWEPALRALYEGLPTYDPSAPLVGSDGREIDPTTSFHRDDDPERMADFLRTTGYILVREVVPRGEIDALLAAAERLREAAREGEPTSWWGQHRDGRTILTRVLNGGTEPRVRALLDDPRLLRIVGLSAWHRDCGLGMHRDMCPLMNGSLFLRPANRETGELRFMPGSWRTAGCSIAEDAYEIGVGIEAEPGDFALHYGDGMHAGPPPTAERGPFRASIVFEYGPPGRQSEQGQEFYDMQMHEIDASQLRPV
jgi:AcrR family transcriptional regulator